MSSVKRLFEGQLLHLVLLLSLLVGLNAASTLPGVTAGSWLGLSSQGWLWLTVLNAVIHQVYVWFCWRIELNGRYLSQAFGANAFKLYAIGFTLLIGARPILVSSLAKANTGSLSMSPEVGYLFAMFLAIPVIYLAYSIRHYFGFRRAFGIDHFEPAYSIVSMVNQGIFRFSNNAMYVFGFLLLWMPAFIWQSAAALVAAAFSHLYIWVHFFATERPDMNRIYGRAGIHDENRQES